MGLSEINERWASTGQPHAVDQDGQFSAYCPLCDTHPGDLKSTLHAAMNEALGHKLGCKALS